MKKNSIGGPSPHSFSREFSTSRKKPMRKGPVTWVSLAVFLLAGGGIITYVRYIKQEKEKGLLKDLRLTLHLWANS